MKRLLSTLLLLSLFFLTTNAQEPATKIGAGTGGATRIDSRLYVNDLFYPAYLGTLKSQASVLRPGAIQILNTGADAEIWFNTGSGWEKLAYFSQIVGGGGGSGSVTSVSPGFGTSFPTITISGSIKVDSTVMATKAFVQGMPAYGITNSMITTWNGAVPSTRTLTINGTAFDLSANRSWTVGDVLTSGSYANPSWITSLAWSKITGAPSFLTSETDPDYNLNGTPKTRTLTINGTTQDLSANRTWNVGDVLTTGSYGDPAWITSLAWTKITGAPLFLTSESDPLYTSNGVPKTRQITINGTTQDLSADRSWTINAYNSPGKVLEVAASNRTYTSIQSAITAASAGDLVYVYPGTYTEQLTLKDGVNIYLSEGTIINNTTSGPTITDNNISLSSTIYGEGQIKRTNVGSGYTIDIQNLGSVVNIQADLVQAVANGTALRINGTSDLYIKRAVGDDKALQVSTGDASAVTIHGGYYYGDFDYAILVSYGATLKVENAVIESRTNSAIHNAGSTAYTEAKNSKLISHANYGFEMSGGNAKLVDCELTADDASLGGYTLISAIAKYGGTALYLHNTQLYSTGSYGIGDGGGPAAGTVYITGTSWSDKPFEPNAQTYVGKENLLISGTTDAHAQLNTSTKVVPAQLAAGTMTNGYVIKNVSGTPTWQPDDGLTNITGYISAGTNVSITGSGTSGSPYVISSTAGGGSVGTLQTVTDNGKTTTNDITSAGIYLTQQNFTVGTVGWSGALAGSTVNAGWFSTPATSDKKVIFDTKGTGGYIMLGDADRLTTAIGHLASATIYRNIAIGVQASATGNFDAIAIGSESQATNNDAIFIGQLGMATGNSAIGMGRGAEALGNGSVSIGVNSKTYYLESVALGDGSKVYKSYGVAIGNNAKAGTIDATDPTIGYNAVALGPNTQAKNDFTVALGDFAEARAPYSMALGKDAFVGNATHTNSIALGNWAQTTAANQFALRLGTYHSRFDHSNLSADRLYSMPNASGTIPMSVKVNGTAYTASSTGEVDLGTISGGGSLPSLAQYHFYVGNASSAPVDAGTLLTTNSSGNIEMSGTLTVLKGTVGQETTISAGSLINVTGPYVSSGSMNGFGIKVNGGTTVAEFRDGTTTINSNLLAATNLSVTSNTLTFERGYVASTNLMKVWNTGGGYGIIVDEYGELLIGYSTRQGNYGLQVNGGALFGGLAAGGTAPAILDGAGALSKTNSFAIVQSAGSDVFEFYNTAAPTTTQTAMKVGYITRNDGWVRVAGYVDMKEISAPGTPAAESTNPLGRWWVRDSDHKPMFTTSTGVTYDLSATGAGGSETDPVVAAINGIVKSNGTTISAAVAGTDYQSPISLTTTGSSGAATFSSGTLNIPNYTLAGLGYTTPNIDAVLAAGGTLTANRSIDGNGNGLWLKDLSATGTGWFEFDGGKNTTTGLSFVYGDKTIIRSKWASGSNSSLFEGSNTNIRMTWTNTANSELLMDNTGIKFSGSPIYLNNTVSTVTSETVKMLVRDESTGKVLKMDVPTGGGGTTLNGTGFVLMSGTSVSYVTDVVRTSQANTYTDLKQTFQTGANYAGLNLGTSLSALPTNKAAGDVMVYNNRIRYNIDNTGTNYKDVAWTTDIPTDNSSLTNGAGYITSTNVVFNNQANSYTAGMKQTFNSSATTAGLRFGGVTAHPSSLSDGDMWYRSDAFALMIRANGVNEQIAFMSNIPTNNNTLTNGAGYITTAGARTAISLTTTGTSGAATYDNTTGVLNIPNYASGSGASSGSGTTVTSGAVHWTGNLSQDANINGVSGSFGINFTNPKNFTVSGTTAIFDAVRLVSTPTSASSAGQFIIRNSTTGDIEQRTASQFRGDIGAGTVTSASVATANGFAGTVASASTTPAITLTTTVTGMLKGDGTSISAATAGTDYLSPTGSATVTNKTLNADNNTITNIPRKVGISIVSPTSSEQISLLQAPSGGATAVSAFVTLRGTSPSVTYKLSYGSTYGTEVGTVVASVTTSATGASSLTINTASIPANNYVWLTTTATSGTIDEFTVHLTYKY